MTRCAHTNKMVRCPKCYSTQTSILYTTKETIIYCQSSKCDTPLKTAFSTTHPTKEDYLKEFKEVAWDYEPVED